MTTTFLPELYENLKTEKSYWKMSQMKEGENRLRIVTKPIAGWIDWHDKKPMRYRPDAKPPKAFSADKPIKPFWTCYVWDYSREALFILEITQMSILKSLTLIAKDEDWGDFRNYDLKINKEGNGKDTRYTLTPLPPKPLLPQVQEALKKSPVRLEALYDGGDPWTDLTEEVLKAGAPVVNSLSETQAAELDSYLVQEPSAKEKIQSSLSLESVYQMKQSDFPKIIKTLKRKLEEKKHVQTAMA